MKNSNQSRKASLTLGLIFTLLSAQAFAANFDFQNLADTPHPTGTGESAWISTSGPGAFTWTDDGITVTATARNLANTQEFYVYMDSDNAGMGVCQTLNASATTGPKTGGANLCSPSSDDNITYNEVLKLAFSQKVTIDLLEIVNGSHGTNFEGNFGVLVDGISEPTALGDFDTTNALTHMFVNPGLLTGTTFHFISGATVAGSSNFNNLNQMYISAVSAQAVHAPEPATLALFGSGLLMLGGMRIYSTRRRLPESCQQQ